MNQITIAWYLTMLPWLAYAQSFQSIHGKVLEKHGQAPLPGVHVTILGVGSGTVTNPDGSFVLEKIPVGRVSLHFSLIGFNTVVTENLELLAGKRLLLTVDMVESVHSLRELTVTSDNRENNFNNMVLAGGRQFSIEESKRFAGSLNDIQRMATSFAGIRAQDDRVNDIVVRGNMPSGMLFRMDGHNIPNPNHWAMPGAAGGTISMLNNNVLRNSDFLTGAFPAEYDALSGVFDLRTRNGNHAHHEFLGQLGFNGLEVGLEGPLSKKQKSSYLINYRKSFLGLLSKFMKSTTGNAIPDYEDVFLKINLPTAKYGTFSILGTGGRSLIQMKPENQDIPGYLEEDLTSGSKTGMIGLTHRIPWSSRTFSSSGVMLSGVSMKNRIDRVWNEPGEIESIREPYLEGLFYDTKIGLNHFTQSKLNSKNTVKAGFFLDFLHSDYIQDVFARNDDSAPKAWTRTLFARKNYLQSLLYASHLLRLNEKVEMTTGLTHKYQSLSQKQVFEYKWALRYRPNDRGTFSFGAGRYSKAPSVIHTGLTAETESENTRPSYPNHDLTYMKSTHWVAGYDHFFTPKFHIRSDVYFQHLYHLVTGKTTQTGKSRTFSAINEFSFAFESTPSELANLGKGRNYGLEITVEQFQQKGMYYLATLSVFDSRYNAADGVWRSTRFNTNLVFNFTGGKEFSLGPRYKLLIDVRTNYSKGTRYTPLDEARSHYENQAVYDYDEAYARQHPPYFRADLRIGLKSDGYKISHEWAFETQNITNRKNVFGQAYDIRTNTLKTQYQIGVLPIGLYRVYF